MDPSKLHLHFPQEAQDHPSALTPSSATSLLETYQQWSSNFFISANQEEHDIASISDHNHLASEIVPQWTPIFDPYDNQSQHHSIINQPSKYPFLKNFEGDSPLNFSTSTDASSFGSSVELMGTKFNDLDVLTSSGFCQTSLQRPRDFTYESTKRKILSSFLLGPDGKKSCLSTSQHSKIKKERLSDKVSALQQLVAPFGKTDTASVLTEAFGYIKFLLEQIQTLSVPYWRTSSEWTAGTIQEVFQDGDEAIEQNLRSKGLCLMPIASVWLPSHLREN